MLLFSGSQQQIFDFDFDFALEIFQNEGFLASDFAFFWLKLFDKNTYFLIGYNVSGDSCLLSCCCDILGFLCEKNNFISLFQLIVCMWFRSNVSETPTLLTDTSDRQRQDDKILRQNNSPSYPLLTGTYETRSVCTSMLTVIVHNLFDLYGYTELPVTDPLM